MRGPNPSRQAVKLSRAALTFRAFHAAIAVEQLFAIGYVWWCALSGRRDRLLRIAAVTLIGEGVLVSANRGDCPLGGLQERLGDPVPLFELGLSPRAAKRAVPTLGALTAAGLALLVVRDRGGRLAARDPREVNKTMRWLFALLLVLQAHLAASYLVPLDREAQQPLGSWFRLERLTGCCGR